MTRPVATRFHDSGVQWSELYSDLAEVVVSVNRQE